VDVADEFSSPGPVGLVGLRNHILESGRSWNSIGRWTRLPAWESASNEARIRNQRIEPGQVWSDEVSNVSIDGDFIQQYAARAAESMRSNSIDRMVLGDRFDRDHAKWKLHEIPYGFVEAANHPTSSPSLPRMGLEIRDVGEVHLHVPGKKTIWKPSHRLLEEVVIANHLADVDGWPAMFKWKQYLMKIDHLEKNYAKFIQRGIRTILHYVAE
jgi:hypothetical protein